MADDDAPGVGPVWIPGAQLAGFIKWTTLHTKYEYRRFFLCLFHCKSMGAKDPQGGAISEPRGMVGRIYVKLQITIKPGKRSICTLKAYNYEII